MQHFCLFVYQFSSVFSLPVSPSNSISLYPSSYFLSFMSPFVPISFPHLTPSVCYLFDQTTAGFFQTVRLLFFYSFFPLASLLTLGICSLGLVFSFCTQNLFHEAHLEAALHQQRAIVKVNQKTVMPKFKVWFWQMLDNMSSWLQFLRKPLSVWSVAIS